MTNKTRGKSKLVEDMKSYSEKELINDYHLIQQLEKQICDLIRKYIDDRDSSIYVNYYGQVLRYIEQEIGKRGINSFG